MHFNRKRQFILPTSGFSSFSANAGNREGKWGGRELKALLLPWVRVRGREKESRLLTWFLILGANTPMMRSIQKNHGKS